MLPGFEQRAVEHGQRLAAARHRRLELEGDVEMVLDRVLAAAGDEDHLLDAGLERLLDRILDQRLVDDRQHLLGHRLGGGQEAGAEAPHREYGLAQLGDHHSSFISSCAQLGTLSAAISAAISAGARARSPSRSPDTITSGVSARLL